MILKNRKLFYQTLFFLLVMNLIDLGLMAQAENRFIRRGNSAFERGEFNEAEIDYKKALEKNNSSAVGKFNLGSSIHEQKNYEEAATIFESLSRLNLPAEKRSKSFHNLGNSLMNMQQYGPAVDAYKNALRLNPSDTDTKYNLLYAQQMLKQQQNQQNQNQDQNNDQNQDQQKNQDQQQQQNQDQQQQQQNQQQEGQQQDSRQEQAQGQPKQISKEDAERMLQALQDRERKTLEKLKMEQLKNAKRVKTEKDW